MLFHLKCFPETFLRDRRANLRCKPYMFVIVLKQLCQGVFQRYIATRIDNCSKFTSGPQPNAEVNQHILFLQTHHSYAGYSHKQRRPKEERKRVTLLGNYKTW